MCISAPKGCVVLVNGLPGTGKVAIARALQTKLQDNETRLIDNHLIIDLAEAVHPGRGSQNKMLRGHLRSTIIHETVELPDPDTVVIMTVCLADNVEDAAMFAECVDVSIWMTLAMSPRTRRLFSPPRTFPQ